MDDAWGLPSSDSVARVKTPPSSSPLWRLFRVVVAVDVRLYRLTGGRVSVVTQRKPSLLLHHVGAKSGAHRVTRVTQLADGDRHVIVASKGGTDRHPAWFHNLMANPDIEIEVGRERKLVHARVLDAGERDELWPRLDAIDPAFPDYRRRAAEAGREIQMVALEPRVAATASVGRGR
jgi:F420H(2)-dependent quinone reductase